MPKTKNLGHKPKKTRKKQPRAKLPRQKLPRAKLPSTIKHKSSINQITKRDDNTESNVKELTFFDLVAPESPTRQEVSIDNKSAQIKSITNQDKLQNNQNLEFDIPILTEEPSTSVDWNKHTKSGVISIILPAALVPIGAAQGFIIMTAKPEQSCYSELSYYLIISGAYSLSMSIMGSVFLRILKPMYDDRVISKMEGRVLSMMKWIGTTVVVLEILNILALSLYMMIAYSLGLLQWNEPNKKNTYCKEGILVYVGCMMAISWFIIVAGCIFWGIVKYSEIKERQRKGNNTSTI